MASCTLGATANKDRIQRRFDSRWTQSSIFYGFVKSAGLKKAGQSERQKLPHSETFG